MRVGRHAGWHANYYKTPFVFLQQPPAFSENYSNTGISSARFWNHFANHHLSLAMGDATAVLARALEVQSGLGQPSQLRIPGPSVRNASPRAIDFHEARVPLSAAQALLSPGDWMLFQHLGPEDGDSVDVHYYVEREGADLSSPNLRRTTVRYPGPVANGNTVIAYRGEQVSLNPQRPDEAKRALFDYASGNHFSVSPGLGGESLHWQVATEHRRLEALFTTMWLIHLDVVSGGAPVVAINPPDMRQGLVGVRDPADECEASKHLPGVKLHVNSCNATQRAMIVAACNPGAITGLGRRAGRYQWARVAVTLYGGTLPAYQQVALGNADATARAIVGLAERFGAMSEASAGLNTALVMYGVEYAGTRLALSCGTPALHEDTHRRALGGSGLLQMRELAGGALTALALFLGRAYTQSAAMALRGAVRSTGSRDVPGSELYLRTNQEGLMRDAGNYLEAEWKATRPNYMHHATYTLVNTKRLWQQTGIVHCLIAGVVAAGSVADEVTQPLRLGPLHNAQVTDIPAYGADRVKEMVSWLTLSSLLEDAGETLNGNMDTMGRQLSGAQRLHPDTRAYAGTTARFVLAGLGAPVLLRTAPDYSMEFEPSRQACEKDGDIGASGPMQVTQTLIERAEPAKESDWVEALLEQRGPLASTIMRRGKAPAYRRAPDGGGAEPVTVSTAAPDAGPSLTRASGLGWGPQPTSGEGMLCGARAIHQSLVSVAAADGEQAPLFDEVHRALINALTPEQQELATAAGVATGDSNFTVDQLTAGLSHLGEYRLGVIHLGERDNPVRLYGGGTGEIILIAHDGHGHWSGVGPNTTSPLRYNNT
ncbi:capsid protein [Betachrysovirus aspergilli]|uniref:Capsid protein n=1 Tax=Betachrysovirus aspergilli TaxID=2164061 RepID=A0A3Q8ERJ0_9VIRU|nr:capsid protein [Betachrysovirus aspergilli]AWC67508.1 capsid protein [Betachrysovirus aspergilli]